MKTLLSTTLLLFLANCITLANEATLNAQETVEAYVDAFKEKNKERMLSCLNDVYFEGYKDQYLKRVGEYEGEQRDALLIIFGVGSIDELKEMKGREILSRFLDHPASNSYWDGLGRSDLIIEYNTLAEERERALIQSIMWIVDKPLAKIETRYFVVRDGDRWCIQAFQKKPYRPEPADRGNG